MAAGERIPPLIKGEAVWQFVRWYIANWNEARLASFVREIPPELGAAFDLQAPHLGVIASSWYPARAVHALIDRMLEGYTEEQRVAFARQAARVTIEASLKGVYRFLFETMMTPTRYANRSQTLFSRYYNTGTMTKTPLGPRSHLTVVSGWTGHHPVLCDVLLYIGEAIYPYLGCRNVAVRRLECVSSGAEMCRYKVSWE